MKEETKQRVKKNTKLQNDNQSHNVIRKKKKKKLRQKFIAVDVWRSEFGAISVRAIFDVYNTKFKVELHNMKNHSFSKCVNALRKLEDPNYISPEDTERY